MTDVTGLVPIGVDPAAKTVTLTEADPSDFSEAFFEYTAKRLRTEAPENLITVSWQDLIDQSKDWQDPANVAGLVFNVGRCGSTLLANMMKAHPELWVLSEPEPLAKPELVARRSHALAARTEADALYRANSILLQRRAQAAGRRLLIKYPSWLAARAPAMAANHPEAAAIGLYRDPFEVVASYIEKPPLFADGMHAPAAIQMSVTPALATQGEKPLTAAGYFASVWVSTMIGATAIGDDRLLLLSYEQLKNDAAQCIEPLFEHLGVNPSTNVMADAQAATQHYAKPRAGASVKFEPGSTHARRSLSPRTRAEVALIVADLEDRLVAHPAHLELSV